MKPQKQNKAPDAEGTMKDSYSIERYESGYVVTKNGKRITEPNMWPITMKALERMLRKDNELV